jgi:predicted membrane protein
MSPSPQSPRSAPQLVLGVIVTTVGALILLDNLGLAESRAYVRFWPVALIAVGLANLWHALDGHGGALPAAVFTSAGTWLLLEQLDLITISIRDVWPALLVLAGGSIVWQALSRSRRAGRDEAGGTDDPNAAVHATAILGSVVRGNNSPRFRGGSITAVMGGCEIDLRNASLDGEAAITVFAMWGGIEIRVPEDWTVVSRVTPVLGGVADSTRAPQAAGRQRLVLRGIVVMAGVEVRN